MFYIKDICVPDGAILAPMAGVTDMPLRALCAEMGAAYTVTEMVSARALQFSPEGNEELRQRHPSERIIAMQLFSEDAAILADAAARFSDGFDMVDINMGCPTPKIVNTGQGSALLKEPKRAQEIMSAVCRAVEKPVTAKLRTGWLAAEDTFLETALRLQDAGAAAIALHGRSRDQFYSGEADWEKIARLKAALDIPVIGNGDVSSAEDAARMLRQTGCDAVMIGRAARGNPWIFAQVNALLRGEEVRQPSGHERYEMAARQAHMLTAMVGEYTAVPRLRKHMAWYLHGQRGSAEARARIMSAAKLEDVLEIMKNVLESV